MPTPMVYKILMEKWEEENVGHVTDVTTLLMDRYQVVLTFLEDLIFFKFIKPVPVIMQLITI